MSHHAFNIVDEKRGNGKKKALFVYAPMKRHSFWYVIKYCIQIDSKRNVVSFNLKKLNRFWKYEIFSNGLQNQQTGEIYCQTISSTISNAEFYARHNELVILYIFTIIILAGYISSQLIGFILVVRKERLNYHRKRWSSTPDVEQTPIS